MISVGVVPSATLSIGRCRGGVRGGSDRDRVEVVCLTVATESLLRYALAPFVLQLCKEVSERERVAVRNARRVSSVDRTSEDEDEESGASNTR